MKLTSIEIILPPTDSIREVCQTSFFKAVLPSVKGRVNPLADEELPARAGVPDPRCHRQLGRSGLLSLLHYRQLTKVIEREVPDPHRVGLYFAGSPGVIDWKTAFALVNCPANDFTDVLRGSLPPKQMLKYGVNTACAQLGIFLGIRGPMYSFLDWRSSGHAQLEQMKIDFTIGSIDLAILLAVASLEDPLGNLIYSQLLKQKLSEASVCAVFVSESLWKKIPRKIEGIDLKLDERFFYSYVGSLVNSLRMHVW